ncbi:NAD(P)-binding protein [Terrilactibacillus sp. BCM23-1]|uniref:precorrin-2 dehydrogenase n=1 Tax=Terrilactibacillus tamarindi TaxID=2599694 RepID=A0A6N8CSK0_9BACI|nr:NAD(P)-binding protein [Terrilactibacillus tamarindi]MTT30966.1 NAD(P)-binding protein [Terrilactibacillus tamarindi]
MSLIPVMVDLNRRHVVIVGGGKIATRKMKLLKETGARITIVSPSIEAALQSLQKNGDFIWKPKQFEKQDIADADVIIVATNDSEINQQVVEGAPCHALINDTEDAERGNMTFPSFFRKGRLTVSTSTGGASPSLAKMINQKLQTLFDDEQYEEYLDFLYDCRKLIKGSSLSKSEKIDFLRKLLDDEFKNKEKRRNLVETLKAKK